MPFIAKGTFNASYLGVQEDSNPSSNRIFINTSGYNLQTLAPYWNQQWHFTLNSVFCYQGRADFAGSGSGQTFSVFSEDAGAAFLILEKGIIELGTLNSSTVQSDKTGQRSTYHSSLDFPNFPVKKSWKTASGNIWINLTDNSNISGSTSLQSRGAVGRYASNILSGSTSSQTISGSSGGAPAQFIYEDSANTRLWAFSGYNTSQVSLGLLNSTDGTASYQIQTSFLNDLVPFSMGTDNGGNIYIATIDGNAFSNTSIIRYSPAGASTVILANSNRGTSGLNGRRTWLSNLRRDTGNVNRRVMYSSHFDTATSVLAPIRYVWDTDSASISASNCTLNYPNGNSYSNYAAVYGNTSYDPLGRSPYHTKPHQFSSSGNNYISFFITEKSPGVNSGSTSRFPNSATSTYLTYQIGANTSDDVLTYHSSLVMANTFMMFRDYMPINDSGSQIVSGSANTLQFWQFNTSLGWVNTGNYNVNPWAAGLDSTNRLWTISAAGGLGFYNIDTVASNQPTTITIQMASNNYTYVGSNIATTAILNAYDSNGNRVTANLNLTIDGATMVFSNGNVTTQTVLTSNNANTVTNLTIFGGGTNNIIATLNI